MCRQSVSVKQFRQIGLKCCEIGEEESKQRRGKENGNTMQNQLERQKPQRGAALNKHSVQTMKTVFHFEIMRQNCFGSQHLILDRCSFRVSNAPLGIPDEGTVRPVGIQEEGIVCALLYNNTVAKHYDFVGFLDGR